MNEKKIDKKTLQEMAKRWAKKFETEKQCMENKDYKNWLNK